MTMITTTEVPTSCAALRTTIACYQAALTVRTHDAHPVDWALTENHLGNAWSGLPRSATAATVSARPSAARSGTRSG